MSIMKTRHPIGGISPTLAHNISLAAGKLSNRPFSALVSSLGCTLKFNNIYSQKEQSGPKMQSMQCPLVKAQLNYQELQEMAKNIKEPVDVEVGIEKYDQGHTEVAGEFVRNGPLSDSRVSFLEIHS